MIKIIEYYLIFALIVIIISVVPILIARMAYKWCPNSKLANFFRKYIISDVDMDDYD
jgi:hypothetical protein